MNLKRVGYWMRRAKYRLYIAHMDRKLRPEREAQALRQRHGYHSGRSNCAACARPVWVCRAVPCRTFAGG